MNDKAMREALDSLSERVDPSTFTASNGLQLKLKRVGQMIIAEANRRLVAPRPPVVWIEEKQRNEENPQDPGYVQAQKNFQFDTAMLAMRVYWILGTEILHLPKGLEPPGSNGWAENILAADENADIPASGPRRYLAWLKLYAVPDEDQLRLLNDIIRYSGGTLEQDVQAAQNSFRNNEGRDTVDRVPPTPENPGGNRDAATPGNDPGLRSDGGSGIRSLPMGQVDDIRLV